MNLLTGRLRALPPSRFHPWVGTKSNYFHAPPAATIPLYRRSQGPARPCPKMGHNFQIENQLFLLLQILGFCTHGARMIAEGGGIRTANASGDPRASST